MKKRILLLCGGLAIAGTTAACNFQALDHAFQRKPSGNNNSGSGSIAVSAPDSVSCTSLPSNTTIASGSNTLTVQVGGNAVCLFNQPCTSVTICEPGSMSDCQTITDILVDTGSFGLRIFSSAITSFPTSELTAVTDGSANPLAECAEFGSNNMWGSVVQADVYLGSESVISSMPMQLVDASFESIPASSACASSVATGPSDSSSTFNGILGVGLMASDDGYGTYWSCNSGTCTSYAASGAQLIPNPVAELGTDNNGVILQMPAISGGTAASAVGALILGVDTEANNASTGTTLYAASDSGTMITDWNGSDLDESFIDSGSNYLFMPSSGLSDCTDDLICLSSTACYQATIEGDDGSNPDAVTFRILSESLATSNWASDGAAIDGPELGFSSDLFDWGLPFFYGRSIYVGITGTSSSVGTGPYWAF